MNRRINYNISKSRKKWKVRVLGWRPASCSLRMDEQIAGPPRPAPGTPEARVDHRLPPASHVTLAYVSFLVHCRPSSWLVWPVTESPFEFTNSLPLASCSVFLVITTSCHPQGVYVVQPWRTPFPIWNASVAPCPVLTSRGRSGGSGMPISLRIVHSLPWSTQAKAWA